MHKKLKILTVVGTRPEIIRLSRIIKKLENMFDHYLIHTNQNYDFNLKDIFFNDLGIKPNIVLNKISKTPIENISNTIIEVDKIIKDIKPDAFLVLGDTNSSLSSISAKRNKVPIFHIEAGNRCFNQNVPEEINRKIVDHISDINLTYSDFARKNLIKEGLPVDQIFKIGSPLYEVINYHKKKIKINNYLNKNKVQKKNFILVSFHREENIDNTNKMKNFFETLIELEKKFKIPILVSTHPRLKKKILNSKIKFNKNIIFHKPFGYNEYLALQMSSKIVISDSGSITEESAILNIPAISLREDIERQEGMDESIIIMSDINKTDLLSSIDIALKTSTETFPKNLNDYSQINVSDKVVRIIKSYVSFVNRKVWMKKKN